MCTFGLWKAPNVHITVGYIRCARSVLGFDHYRVVCSLGLQLVRELFQEQFAVLDSLA